MTYDHIKTLLQLSLNFNTSTISHSFSIGGETQLMVRCVPGTFIIEVISSETQQVDHYVSIESATDALYKKINGTNPD